MSDKKCYNTLGSKVYINNLPLKSKTKCSLLTKRFQEATFATGVDLQALKNNDNRGGDGKILHLYKDL